MRIWGTGILKGMWISIRNMARGPITVQYPKEKLVLPERARWAVAMKLDEEGCHKCTACMACEKACPDFIIKIDSTTGEDRSKHIDAWNYEIGACMMCGLCVEACPFDAITLDDHDLPQIDPNRCVGCGLCAKACPKKIVVLVPKNKKPVVKCFSNDKGALVKMYCKAGCIGCGLCVKNCPSQAITMTNNLAKIDSKKCTDCGICITKCPRKSIVRMEL